MNLPSNFNQWEHLQDTLRRVQNRIVREEFRDVGGEDWTPSIGTSRGSLRVACTLDDQDTAVMTELRLFLFYVILRKAQDFQQPVYGIPTALFQQERRFKPQILLYFQEDFEDIEPGYAPVTGEISFRLMDEDSNSLTETKLNNFASRIRSEFANGGGLIWRKGKEMCTYNDWGNGYQLQLLCRGESDGRQLISKILAIRNQTPDWSKSNLNSNLNPVEAFPTVPGNQTILGKSRKRPRRRPIANVRFQHALIHIHGLPNPICLVDRNYLFKNPILRVA